MPPTLTDLSSLACQAGDILRQSFGQHLQVDHKGLIDLVTEVDRQSEQFLLGYIQEHFAGDRIVAEESGVSAGSSDHMWYIDPLDGTVNYVHGLPIYSVSIAYAEQGKLRLGVVYDPMRDELFSAEAGLGAWLNGEPIHTAQVPDLDHALLVTGFPYDIRTNSDNNLDHYVHFALRSQGVRRLGSAALDLSYVACGRLDGFWELRLNPWDVAAGGLIARQAGAVVTNLAGREDFISPPQSILAANPTIHALMLKEFNRK
ncbi:MAG TPA: inositol monophosphatase family protein [Anaerolineales bacterium]|nr:inositol monophosphatase family protein [Anaerolineales bacterium]